MRTTVEEFTARCTFELESGLNVSFERGLDTPSLNKELAQAIRAPPLIERLLVNEPHPDCGDNTPETSECNVCGSDSIPHTNGQGSCTNVPLEEECSFSRL